MTIDLKDALLVGGMVVSLTAAAVVERIRELVPIN